MIRLPSELIMVIMTRIAESLKDPGYVINLGQNYCYFSNVEMASKFVHLFRAVVGKFPITIDSPGDVSGARVIWSDSHISIATDLLSYAVDRLVDNTVRSVINS